MITKKRNVFVSQAVWNFQILHGLRHSGDILCICNHTVVVQYGQFLHGFVLQWQVPIMSTNQLNSTTLQRTCFTVSLKYRHIHIICKKWLICTCILVHRNVIWESNKPILMVACRLITSCVSGVRSRIFWHNHTRHIKHYATYYIKSSNNTENAQKLETHC